MPDFHDTQVFVSGGAGVIGAALVKLLHQQGANIFVGDLKPRPSDFPSEIKYRQGDLNTITKEELDSFRPEFFFHLAATFERSVETYDFWGENFHHNVKLSHHLMDCLKECNSLKRVVFASSYLVYDPKLYLFDLPQADPVRLDEYSPICPRNLCGMAKLLHEQEISFLQSFKQQTLSTVSARIFRSYGKNSRDVISRWIRACLKGEPITVFRKEGFFDFVFAENVAEGLMRLALSEATGPINLGTDNARQIGEVLDILQQHFPKMQVKEEASDIPIEVSQANMDRFKEVTGWIPPHQLEDAIPKIIDHEKT
ncbi:MAG: CDP-glucose 4,6-dehydratase [Chlamydiae bacterium]|nr:CDP-glucose 4,6-dehydratase [Chlamydiota bacterium]